jgi:hypothetical protein
MQLALRERDALTLGGTTVEFEDLDSLRASAGLRLGANIVGENYVRLNTGSSFNNRRPSAERLELETGSSG